MTIRLNPHLAGAVAQEIERLEPDLCDHIQVVPTDAIPEGDVRIAWRNGGAVRDTAALWSEIASILGANGLLPVSAAKELAHVE